MVDLIEHQIAAELDAIERDEGVRIVYACESGSRAWGFASEDSDYDVRFLYVHPPAWYLSVQRGRDVIERPIREGLDISGWDLPKALQLFRKSNPPLLEWLQSTANGARPCRGCARCWTITIRRCRACTTTSTWRKATTANTFEAMRSGYKKYFYVLRPVLACIWIERGFGVVPTEFAKLVERVVDDPAVRNAIDELMTRKRTGAELDRGPRIPVISDFLNAETERLSASHQGRAKSRDTKELDRLFLDTLIEAFGPALA